MKDTVIKSMAGIGANIASGAIVAQISTEDIQVIIQSITSIIIAIATIISIFKKGKKNDTI